MVKNMSDKVSLLKLAVQLRHAQFYAHMAHNLTCGPTFYQDHDAFGDLYKAYEGEYDAVIERFIGLGGSPSIYGVTKNALAMLEECQGDNKPSVFFEKIIAIEGKIQSAVDVALTDKQSEGTKNFLQGIADSSEQRLYKLRQRNKLSQ